MRDPRFLGIPDVRSQGPRFVPALWCRGWTSRGIGTRDARLPAELVWRSVLDLQGTLRLAQDPLQIDLKS